MNQLLISKGKKPKKGKVVICLNCQKETYKKPCHSNRPKSFCSRICHTKFQKKEAFNFPCKICSKPIFTQPAQLKLRARSTCSPSCRSKLSKNRSEERAKEKGYTQHQLDRLARTSPEAKNWRITVFKRDNYTCQICYKRGEYIEADHIKPFAYFPELRFDINNGRTLCKNCHNKTKISAKKMKEIYGKK